MKKKLILLTGPSGVGKTTIAQLLLKQIPEMKRLVTFTTREPRPNEIDGIDYHFVTDKQFQKIKESADFFEHDTHYGYDYGNSKNELLNLWQSGKLPLMVLDINGTRTVQKIMPEAVSIFLKPDSMENLKTRILKRPMSAESFQQRWETAEKEMELADVCDFTVINAENKLDEAVAKIRELIENLQIN
ncbi:guanylate kinase [Patescibacteria group bacterium]|nr:guanylate kinase [Patescibacteria group bacterium]